MKITPLMWSSYKVVDYETKHLSCLLVSIYKHRITFLWKIAHVFFSSVIFFCFCVASLLLCYMWHCTKCNAMFYWGKIVFTLNVKCAVRSLAQRKFFSSSSYCWNHIRRWCLSLLLLYSQNDNKLMSRKGLCHINTIII
jgi:hypothetical protein